MARLMRRNYRTDDICVSMQKQMEVMWKLSEKYPSMDFYRMLTGRRKNGCRITIMGEDIAEVWTEELIRKKSIKHDFAGSVISNFVTSEDKIKAIHVNDDDYSAMGENVFGTFAYQSTWTYKWIRFAKTYDELYQIIEHVILTYAEESGADLFIRRDTYEKEYYRSVVETRL